MTLNSHLLLHCALTFLSVWVQYEDWWVQTKAALFMWDIRCEWCTPSWCFRLPYSLLKKLLFVFTEVLNFTTSFPPPPPPQKKNYLYFKSQGLYLFLFKKFTRAWSERYIVLRILNVYTSKWNKITLNSCSCSFFTICQKVYFFQNDN